MATPRRLRAPPERRTGHRAYRLALEGRLPAEALSTTLRWRLVAELHRAGLSDVQIAEWTLLSTYTAGRIRSSMGLKPNRKSSSEGSQTPRG
jgi:hypothetical protein